LPWSAWVKPVLFAHVDEAREPRRIRPLSTDVAAQVVESLAGGREGPAEPAPYRSDARIRDSALVIDLPGRGGLRAALAFAEHGFRPVPLYNALPSQVGAIDVGAIVRGLVDAAPRLAELHPSGPPAFLLDADRLSPSLRLDGGVFDNRSVCSESDFPSADRLLSAGIVRVVLVQERNLRPMPDLEPVLWSWQTRGIALGRAGVGPDETSASVEPFRLKRRWLPRRLVFGAWRLGLRARSDGAFGEVIRQGG
jgi:hypothetical protein